MASNDTPRAARKARPKTSLKMQAIGFLSRREHSRQELRAKLLASLRRRAREEAESAQAQAQAQERHARDVADAPLATPSNGIDAAFAPPTSATPGPNPCKEREAGASRGPRSAVAPPAASLAMPGARVAPLLEHVRFASGDALTGRLRASLAAAAAMVDTEAQTNAGVRAGVQHIATATSTATGTGNGNGNGNGAAAVAVAARSEADPETDVDAETETDGEGEGEPEAVVDELLDWLVANKYLSEERFVESRVNARARKQGTMLIKQELSRHGLALEPAQAAALRETEFARAQALWARKFGEVGADARARAKQARFLASRGFAPELVRRIVGGHDEF